MDGQQPAGQDGHTSSVLIGDRQYTVTVSPDPTTPDLAVVDLAGDAPTTGRLTVHPSNLADLGPLFSQVFGTAQPVTRFTTAPGAYGTLLDPDGGGAYSTPAEQKLGRAILALCPESEHFAPSALTGILRATVAAVSDDQGGGKIEQILDLGHGLPSKRGLVHQVAQAINPMVRTVGVDIDGRTVKHMWSKIAFDDDRTKVFRGDLTDVNGVRAHHWVRELLNFNQPMLLLFGLTGQFITSDELLAKVFQAWYDVLAPGSQMAITLPCADAPGPMYRKFLKVVDLYKHPERLDLKDGDGTLKPVVWALRDNLQEIEDCLPAPGHWGPGVMPIWRFRPDLKPWYPVTEEQAKLWGNAMVIAVIYKPLVAAG